ncbi:shikimate dehydrogenase [Jatrophihabitans telluris]|uniref:Shikimate dehydrogenase n=1 Tax=Jatrophihabitans telluris TaxID=2038343 RepID=A0ABY4QT91_9ACTN|nr:shikimate dehydrogenase [Jatrophihabitans telluris]UQX86785.1 shikimate dehydrogenase [Jatrophihabitans telluris]
MASEADPARGRAAVLGSPVSHSLSPDLHNAAYAALGLTGWHYDAIECTEADLGALLVDAPPNQVGYSCTMPLKREVLRVATSISAQAAAIGAGNTLLRVDEDWYADNTDWIGIRDALAEAGVPAGGRIVVLGAGGTAQAALAALVDVETVTVLVREPARAVELRATAERLDVAVTVARLDSGAGLGSADLVISTLPAGVADPLGAFGWRPEQAVFDVIYRPWPTALAAGAAAAGATVVSGAELLLFQAARQVELMTGRAAPVQAMRAALSAARR